MRFFLFIVLFALSSCAFHKGFRQRSYQGEVEGKSSIRMWVPNDYLKELMFLEPRGGATQFYTYRGGAVFYVSWKATEPVFNVENIRRSFPDSIAAAPIESPVPRKARREGPFIGVS